MATHFSIYSNIVLGLLEAIYGVVSFGESSSSKGSKILLTSRKKDVCLSNRCQCPVEITSLKAEEAWDLFQDTVGACHIDSLQNETLAKEVCSRCAGLPLLIRAVGKALKFMSPRHHVWKDALQKLEKGNFKNIPGIDDQVYACVKLSIDRLREDAKFCLLLCSLFPEDADIHIKTLIQVAMGSQIILDGDGESAICAMVDELTISSLLLDCRKNNITKLHDIIRDVARFIAFTDPKYAFLHERCRSRLRENAHYSTSKLLRLDVDGNDVHFPEDLFSFQPLGKLKMLVLDNCDIRVTDVSLYPKNLENLCIRGCNLPSSLDLKNLECLRKLDIRQDLTEVIMVPNAISSLSSLEELYIPYGFRFSDDARDIAPKIDEISKLTCLTSLQVLFSNFEACQGTSIFFKLRKYDLSIGQRWNTEDLPNSTRMIELINVEVKGDEALQSLIERAEEVTLSSTDVDISSIWKSNREAFKYLRDLTIHACDTGEHIARISEDEIQHGHQPRTYFSKRTILKIKSCSAIKYLFCKSVAKCLVQLQELDIDDCPAMEVILMNEGTNDGEIINFAKLKRLELEGVPSLTSFYREKKEMHSGSTNNCVISCAQFQPLFDGMVAFPSLEVLSMWDLEHTVTDIWGKHMCDDNNKIVSSSFFKLKSLKVHECNKLKSVIPLAMLHRLQNLEYLYIENCRNLRNAFPPCIARDLIHLKRMNISWCGMMREIVGEDDKKEEEIIDDHPDHGIIVFPELTELKLVDLENLASFWCYWNGESYTYKVELPSLVKLELKGCGEINLEAIKLSRDDSTWPLKSISIKTKKRVQLRCKWKMHLYNLKSLTLYRCWWHDPVSLCFPKLEELYVVDCGCPALFTISGFISLQHLRKLEISECALLEEIVEDVRCDEHAGMDTKTIKLWQLDSVVLRDLPKLKSFIHIATYECYMPALKKVEVDNCGLSSLFTCSVFRNLHHLETLVVSNCQFLEGIVEDGREDETSDTNDKNITLFQLSKVTLEDLPNLKSFSRTVNYSFNMPKLESFCLFWCPQLEYFTCLKTSTGLVLVITEWNTMEDIADLNDYIMQNRKREMNSVKVSNQERETESGMVEEHPLKGNRG